MGAILEAKSLTKQYGSHRALHALNMDVGAGEVLCLATIGGLILSLYILVRGRAPVVNWERLGPIRLTVGFGLMLFAGWGFKMAHGLLAGSLPAR